MGRADGHYVRAVEGGRGLPQRAESGLELCRDDDACAFETLWPPGSDIRRKRNFLPGLRSCVAGLS